MKFRIYALILIFLVPLQASLSSALAIFGVSPDIALSGVYMIGLLTGPRDGAFFGMGLGLLHDIHAGGILGLTGFTRGLIGLMAGVLGRHVLNVASMANVLFITGFGLAEGVIIAVFMETYYGDVPFNNLFFGRLLPGSLYAGVVGAVIIRLLARRHLIERLIRKGIEREVA